ncbi:hypothetical protein HYQ44_004369 [Verticillium longisporum]|nr:hypothetical protein HYQ44_004369 [Verticillium longisporum]
MVITVAGIHSSQEHVGKHRLRLAEIDDGRGQKTQEVERHLLLGEGADAKGLNTLSNNVVAAHEASATSPTNDGAANDHRYRRYRGWGTWEERPGQGGSRNHAQLSGS